MNYIITKNIPYYIKIGNYNFCSLEDIELPEVLAVDSETTGLKARHENMFCLQIGTKINNYIIDFYSSEDAYIFEDVIPYLKDKELIFHNATFDLQFFYKHNFFPDKIRDTMVASKILYNGDVENQRNDFGSVMKRELDVFYDKTDQKNINVVKLSQASTIQYSFNDVDKLIQLHEALCKKIDKGGYRATYDLHCQYTRVLAYMESCGLPISSEVWKAKMSLDIENQQKWKNIIIEYIYDNLPKYADKQIDIFDNQKRILISIESPLQMVKVFNALGIKTKDKDDKDSINEKIISKSKHEFVKLWLDFQEANHRVTTFGDKIYQKIENERIYTNFNIAVDTARISSRKGEINFLNFPSDKITRDCFQANKGNVMVVCDYSAQEAILLADQSKDIAMTASVLEGVDLHSLLTKKIHPDLAHLSDEDISKLHKDKRTQAKISRFALSFGGGAFTLHINQNIPMNEAVKIENSFKELHEGMYIWGNNNFINAVKLGYIESLDGWKLKLPEFSKYKGLEKEIKNFSKEDWQLYKIGKEEYKKYWEAKNKKELFTIVFKKEYDFYISKKSYVSQYFKLQGEYKRLSLNNPIQSSAAHMTKYATVLMFNWIKENNYINNVKIVNVIHDEIVIECEKSLKEIVVKNLEDSMLKAGNHYLKDLTIKADAHFGSSWQEAK